MPSGVSQSRSSAAPLPVAASSAFSQSAELSPACRAAGRPARRRRTSDADHASSQRSSSGRCSTPSGVAPGVQVPVERRLRPASPSVFAGQPDRRRPRLGERGGEGGGVLGVDRRPGDQATVVPGLPERRDARCRPGPRRRRARRRAAGWSRTRPERCTARARRRWRGTPRARGGRARRRRGRAAPRRPARGGRGSPPLGRDDGEPGCALGSVSARFGNSLTPVIGSARWRCRSARAAQVSSSAAADDPSSSAAAHPAGALDRR